MAPLIVRIDDNQTNEQTPIPSASTTAQSATDDDISPPTPGVDDTPYIRFAIDQLTRDEELTGRGRGGSGESEESYPVERIIPDEGLGYYKQGKQLPLRGDQAAGRSAEKSASLGKPRSRLIYQTNANYV